jgi:hypothetical protein
MHYYAGVWLVRAAVGAAHNAHIIAREMPAWTSLALVVRGENLLDKEVKDREVDGRAAIATRPLWYIN